jgi:uncharacterized membrane protein
MEALITSIPGVLAVCCGLIAFAIWGGKKPVLNKLGPAMICILGALVLSNTRVIPIDEGHPVYDFLGTHIINISIAVLLLDTDLKKIRQLSFQPFAAMLIACAVVCVMTIIGGLIFARGIGPEGWKVAGMFVGTYTGGSSNLNAIAIALNTSSSIQGAANAADYVIYTPFIILIMWAGSSLGKIAKWNKFWPYSVPEEDLKQEGGSGYMAAKEWSILDIALMIAIGFAIVGISTWIANTIVSINPDTLGTFRATFRVLLITTGSVVLAQTAFIKNIRGKGDIGLYLTLFYLVYIGATINLAEFLKAAPSIGALCVIAVFGSLVIHFFLCRLFKIKWQYGLLSMQAAIGSQASAAALAAASGWETLVSVGIVIGLFGNAVGNYLGLGVAYILKGILGM